MSNLTGRQKQIQDTLKLYEAELAAINPPKKGDTIRCRFEPYYLGSRPDASQQGVLIPIRYRSCPGNFVEKQIYEVSIDEAKSPWWVRV